MSPVDWEHQIFKLYPEKHLCSASRLFRRAICASMRDLLALRGSSPPISRCLKAVSFPESFVIRHLTSTQLCLYLAQDLSQLCSAKD